MRAIKNGFIKLKKDDENNELEERKKANQLFLMWKDNDQVKKFLIFNF